MWQRLCVVAFCGLPALWAGVCGGLPAGPANGSEFRDLFAEHPPALSFHLAVKAGGRGFRITVRPASHEIFDGWQQHPLTLVHAGDIEVASCQDGKQLQLLPFTAWQPLNFGPTFRADDINFDGYLDFSIVTDYAAKYVSRSYWVYDSGSGRFVQNDLTQKLTENCLRGGGCWKASSIDFDPEKREVRAHYLASFGRCRIKFPDFTGDRYHVEGNRLILIHKEEISDDNCTVTHSDLRGGVMRVTKIRRFDTEGHVLE